MFNSNLGDPLVYWLFRILLLIVLAYSGYLISRLKEKEMKLYWSLSIAPIILFSLFYGLRWMRGADYMHYVQDVEQGSKSYYINDETEIVYRWWCDLCANLHIAPEVVFTIYAALFIGGIFAVLRFYKKAAVWTLPMTVLITGASVECHFRQYFAVSFILYAFAFMLDKKRLLAALSFLLAYLIHSSTIFPIALILVSYLYKDKVRLKNIYLYILVAVYLALYFFWDKSMLGPFATWLSMLSFDSDSNFMRYVDNADRWFTDEGSLSFLKGTKSAASSFLYISMKFASTLATIILGYLAAKKDYRVLPMFVCTYIANVFFILAGDIEIIDRIGKGCQFFVPILLGVGLVYSDIKRKYINYVYAVYLMYFVFYLTIRQIGDPGEFGCAFIWDK